jgi:hypothetical protein
VTDDFWESCDWRQHLLIWEPESDTVRTCSLSFPNSLDPREIGIVNVKLALTPWQTVTIVETLLLGCLLERDTLLEFLAEARERLGWADRPWDRDTPQYNRAARSMAETDRLVQVAHVTRKAVAEGRSTTTELQLAGFKERHDLPAARAKGLVPPAKSRGKKLTREDFDEHAGWHTVDYGEGHFICTWTAPL